MPLLLELFSGTGSIGRAFRARGWEVFSVDNDPRANASLTADILQVKASDLPERPDLIWGSPPCQMYTLAGGRRTQGDLEASDALVQKTLQLIEELGNPPCFIENPFSGRLKSRGLLDHLRLQVVDYCQFGTPYRKRTAIWTKNVDWVPSKPLCKHDCPASVDGRRHLATAQRGPPGPRFTQRELYRIPAALCDEIAEYCDTVWKAERAIVRNVDVEDFSGEVVTDEGTATRPHTRPGFERE